MESSTLKSIELYFNLVFYFNSIYGVSNYDYGAMCNIEMECEFDVKYLESWSANLLTTYMYIPYKNNIND